MEVTPKSKFLRLAGNSIVVSVLYYVFRSLFIEETQKISLF